jgi:hypothetical protein
VGCTIFEKVSFNGDLIQLVTEQLATGKYRGREDSAPGDWLARAWHALPRTERSHLTAAIHQVLTHSNPQVRAEAVRLLNGNRCMADPQRLLNLVEQHWDLFRGLRGPQDAPGIDRGCDLVQLVADRVRGSHGAYFRQTMALDPVYGIHVLAALAEEDTVWTAEHIHELVTPELDPNGSRLNVLVYNLQQWPEAMQNALANLAGRQPALKERLAQVIRSEVRSSELRNELLQILKIRP